MNFTFNVQAMTCMLVFITLVNDAVRWSTLGIIMKDAMSLVLSGLALLMLLKAFIITILISMFTDLLISTMLTQQKIKELSFKQDPFAVQ